MIVNVVTTAGVQIVSYEEYSREIVLELMPDFSVQPASRSQLRLGMENRFIACHVHVLSYPPGQPIPQQFSYFASLENHDTRVLVAFPGCSGDAVDELLRLNRLRELKERGEISAKMMQEFRERQEQAKLSHQNDMKLSGQLSHGLILLMSLLAFGAGILTMKFFQEKDHGKQQPEVEAVVPRGDRTDEDGRNLVVTRPASAEYRARGGYQVNSWEL